MTNEWKLGKRGYAEWLAARRRVEAPTEDQAKAGNYRKGHATWQGLDITIETPRGGHRRGRNPDGTPWARKLTVDYGYVKGTEGADGDHVDVMVGPDLGSGRVWVVDQVKPNGHFDEHKVLLGFRSMAAALAGYRAQYPRGWRVGPMTEWSVEEFKTWLAKGRRATKRSVATPKQWLVFRRG